MEADNATLATPPEPQQIASPATMSPAKVPTEAPSQPAPPQTTAKPAPDLRPSSEEAPSCDFIQSAAATQERTGADSSSATGLAQASEVDDAATGTPAVEEVQLQPSVRVTEVVGGSTVASGSASLDTGECVVHGRAVVT